MIRAFQWDLARQTERLDFLLAQLPRYADWGYNELYLHLEDAVAYPSLPDVARADAYTTREFEKLVTAATRAGIKVVPIVNLLGHTQYLIKTPALRDLNELRAPDGSPLERGQLCPLHPCTLEIAAKLIGDMAPFCTAGKVHVGLDESFHLGKHPLSRAEIARFGLAEHFARYVGRLHELVRPHGLRMGIWADMLALLPEAIPRLPRGLTAYDWYYYPFKRHPRVELFNFAEYDLAPALRAREIAYWGCPMNGSFRYEPLPVFADRLGNLRSWWKRCHHVGAEGFLVTSWEPNRLTLEMTTVVDAAAACLWLDPQIDDNIGMLAKGFARVFGKSGALEAARAALRCDEHAFAGYAKWELNDRWDAAGGPEGPIRAARSARFFDRRAHQKNLPAPFAASAALNAYLAERESFLRTAAHLIQKLRRLHARGESPSVNDYLTEARGAAGAFAQRLRAGRTAARAMWRRTRDPKITSPNEQILQRDAERLRAWRRWLAAAAKNPARVFEAAPMQGRWQLSFSVHNFAPALQKILVEQQTNDGSWTILAERFTIEFRATAARPRANLRREFSVSLEDPTRPLRIALRGVGEIAVSHVVLTDGVVALRPKNWPVRQRRTLGAPALKSGFPDLHLAANRDEISLVFPKPPKARADTVATAR
ncbi:MAG: family 20 glycosylhydrolase [Verrucomicrobia bacterium]|nr:family 20 glycosylhydrolase [Verrucomicrobiota bacterium]